LETALAGWLDRAAASPYDPARAAEALAWCHGLPRLAAVLDAGAWWRLWEHLLSAAVEAEQLRLAETPLVHQLLAGELALSLGYWLPELVPCRRRLVSARRALSAGLLGLVDGEGLPRRRHLRLLRPLLACWTRCRALGDRLRGGPWNKAAQTRYERLLCQAPRLLHPDATSVLSASRNGQRSADRFEGAVLTGGNESHARSVAAVLRAGWNRSDPRLAVVYPGTVVRTELHRGRELLWAGAWDLAVRREGRVAEPRAAWEELRWVCDAEVDYLELELRLTAGLRVRRHVLLAREDRFLLLADAVLGQQPARLEYRGCLPLGPGVSFQPAGESREGFLVGSGGKRRALVMPLAQPEWRGDPRGGSLGRTDRGLELRQSAYGRSLFAPLWLDLKPQRMWRPLTWRPLTVAEQFAVLPPEAAVGYRVRVGRQQWLVYRALASRGHRTLLGHNLVTEMLVARFRPDGHVEPLLEIK